MKYENDPRVPGFMDAHFKLPFKAMFIGAHPDDGEYYFGQTATKLIKAGAEVTFVSVCSGDNGHQSMDPSALAARRYAETQAAAKAYGLKEYLVLGEHDCLVEPTILLRQKITRLVRERQPNMLVTHRTCDYHADHRCTGQVVQDSTYLFAVPLFCRDTPVPETLPFVMYGGDPFTVPRPLRADLLVDGDDVFDTTLKALACHESQIFEWLPPEYGVDPDSIPKDAAGRFEWIKTHVPPDFLRDGILHKAAVEKLFGGPRKYVNAFELCEYSRPPCKQERDFLASIDGIKWNN